MAPPIRKLADRFMSNPSRWRWHARQHNADIEQRLMIVGDRGKRAALERVLRAAEVKNAIVFPTADDGARAGDGAEARRFKSGDQGDMEQADRIRELDRFKARVTILVARATSRRAGWTSRA
jgi:superfamily II DNA/RNA helicase